MTTSYGSNWILRKQQHTVDEIPTVSASCRPYHISDVDRYCDDDRQVQINRLNDRIVGRYEKREALQPQHDQHPPLKSTSSRCLKIPTTTAAATTSTTTASFRQKANQLVDDSFTYLDVELNRCLDHRPNGRHGRADADLVDSCCPTCASSPYSVPYDQEPTPLNKNNNNDLLKSANIQPDLHGTSSTDEYSERNLPHASRPHIAYGGGSAKLTTSNCGQQYAFGQQAQYKQLRNAGTWKIWLDDANVANPINPLATDAISLNDILSTEPPPRVNTAYQSGTDWKMRDRRLCIAILLTALILLVACAGFALALYYD